MGFLDAVREPAHAGVSQPSEAFKAALTSTSDESAGSALAAISTEVSPVLLTCIITAPEIYMGQAEAATTFAA